MVRTSYINHIGFLCLAVLFLIPVCTFGQTAGTNARGVERVSITIDTGKTSAEISPYIYGQFIEHLGRCIYGGIWAEMLEDRKFFYAVGEDKSPWKAVGDNSCVTVVREDSYVGQQAPAVKVSSNKACGTVQGSLGLVKGRKYEGRIILARAGDVKIEVSLIWGAGQNERQTITIDTVTDDYTKIPLGFTAGGDTDDGRLEIIGRGTGTFYVGTVSLMPADNVEGMRADTLALLRQLDSPIYRWPGGNFVSGYDWRDGVGNRDKRPPKKNLAWNSMESNDFGIDEFMTFCRLLGTEATITVNTGFGDAFTAAQEVEYCNGSVDTAMGKWRAANGRPEPYDVKWWYVGNEMWGNWQLGRMQLKHYVIKHNLFAEAMRKVDPSIKLIAVGQVGEWSEQMLKSCAEHMDVISEHFYCDRKKSVTQHIRQIPVRIRSIVRPHRDYRKRLSSLEGKDIRIAIDEWNYWSGEKGRYYLMDALGIAEGLHEMYRNSDIVFIAKYAQTVNVLAAIRTSKTEAVFSTNGLVLKLYRRHFGQMPVAIEGDRKGMDIAAAWTRQHDALTVAAVNPTMHEFEIILDIKGADLTGEGQLHSISGSDPMAYNEPGKKAQVTIETEEISGATEKLSVWPLSINIYELPTR